jgi:multicomponent Na+:H+ antiporter subunit F
MILAAAALAILVTMALAIVRALLGPSIYDRILAVNMFGTKTVLLIALIAAIAGRGDYLDIALVYAMINFIAIIAVMKYFEYGNLGHDGKHVEDGSAPVHKEGD